MDDQESDDNVFAKDADEDQENYAEDNSSEGIFVDLSAPKKTNTQNLFMDTGRRKTNTKKLDTIIVND